MTTAFIDANVIIAVLNKQYPLYSKAARVLSVADDKRFRLFTSPTCLAIAFYFAGKKCGEAAAFRKIEILTQKLQIAGITQQEVAQTLANKKVKDFEDGLEYYAAVSAGCKIIVTEDSHDFYFSALEVMNCETFLRSIALPVLAKPR
ncbi:MAG: PIN domain-containing protein [Chitinophagaceae bacterium]|jgi:predicted nucleic acid-binding protein|nr:PIN domain-containing protein [Chitinophagaceae bacterium]